MSSNDDINSFDSLGDVYIDVEAGVTQSDDLVDAHGGQSRHLNPEGLHLVLEDQVGSSKPKGGKQPNRFIKLRSSENLNSTKT